MKSVLSLSVAVILFPSGMLAQKTVAPAPVTSPGASNPTTTGFPNTTNPSTTLPRSSPSSGIAPRPIYISGRVSMQDGTPPPGSVRVEKICGGNPRPEGYTDAKGRFSFQLDAGIDVMSDAGDSTYIRPGSNPGMGSSGSSSGFSKGNSVNCEIRAVLPGFRSDAVSLAFHDSLENPDIGTIVLHRMGNVEGTTISMTSLNAPKDAQKAYQKGRDAMKKQKPEEAEAAFRKALDAYPKYAAAWYDLGLTEIALKQPAEAEKSFQQSIASDPKLVTPYIELALIFAKARDWQKTLEISERAIKLNPVDFPEAYFYNAVANLNLNNVDAAEKSAREAQKLDTQHHLAQLDKLINTIVTAKKEP